MTILVTRQSTFRQPLSNSNILPLNLPVVRQSQLDVSAIDWSGLTKRFMNDGELEVVVALVRSVSPETIVEIGVNEGRTAKAILQNVHGVQRYYGVDVMHGYVPTKAVQRNEVPSRPGWMAKNDRRFSLILKRNGSLDINAKNPPFENVDVVFIDGDHGWKTVMHDTMLAERVVKPGGLIIWHDYHGMGNVDVRDVLEVLSANGRKITHVEGTWLAFEKR